MTIVEFDHLIKMLKSSDNDDCNIAKENIKNLKLDFIPCLLIAKGLALESRSDFLKYLDAEMQIDLRYIDMRFHEIYKMIKENGSKEENKILFKYLLEQEMQRYYADIYTFCNKIDVSIQW